MSPTAGFGPGLLPGDAHPSCDRVLVVDAEQLIGKATSDTTLRARRDEWEAAGVFAAVVEEALAAYDKVIGLDLSEVAVDCSQHKAPGVAKGPAPTLLTGEGPVGSGRCSPTRRASHRLDDRRS